MKDEYGEYKVEDLSMVRGGKGKPLKVYFNPRKHLIADTAPTPRGWYKSKTESDRVRPRPCYTEALLTTPYGGFCPVNCAHCYINAGTRGYRSTGYSVVHTTYPDKLRRWVDKLMISGAAYITSFSEPFHPLEDEYGITKEISQIFVDAGLPLFYLSRKIPPEWAVEMLLQNPYSYMQWSINTSNPKHYRLISPGSFELDDVFDTMRDLSQQGIFISVQCNPIIAGISSLDDIVGLVWDVAECGGHHIIFKFIEQVCNNRNVIVDRMHKRGLPRVEEFDRLFSQVIGGVYTIQQDVRIEWLKVLLEETRKVGVTMSLCYEYYDNGKAGANLAPWFTTSDQCHGPGVPIYYRPEPGETFEPLPGCYRKGCLYCATYGTRACDSNTLVQAKALTYKDLRSVQLYGNFHNWWLDDSCYDPDTQRVVRNDLASGFCDVESFANPNMITDAEIWGWPTLDEELEKYG